ncbi:hypothetical protein HK102_001443 [Quaeritorhiza haematococci]|nr:hypothetical protein HK102_001443 [Quaeritorhiza haematococci]
MNRRQRYTSADEISNQRCVRASPLIKSSKIRAIVRICSAIEFLGVFKIPDEDPTSFSSSGSKVPAVKSTNVRISTVSGWRTWLNGPRQHNKTSYVTNLHFRSAAPMNLSKLADVISLAYFVHGGKDGLKLAKQAKIDRAQERQRKAEERIQQRKDHIISLLAASNVPAVAADNHRFFRCIQTGELFSVESFDRFIEAEQRIQKRKDHIVSLLAARNLPATTADGDRFTKYIQNGEIPEGKSPEQLVEAEHQKAMLNALKAQRREEFRKCIELLGVPWPDHPENLKFAEKYATYGTDLDELVALEKAQYDREQIEKARREELGIGPGPTLQLVRTWKPTWNGNVSTESAEEPKPLTNAAPNLSKPYNPAASNSPMIPPYVRGTSGTVMLMAVLWNKSLTSWLEWIAFGAEENACVKARVSRGVWWPPRNDVVKEGDQTQPPETLWGPIEEMLGQELRNSVEQNIATFLNFYLQTNTNAVGGVQMTEPTVEQFSNWLDTAWHERSDSAAAVSSSSTSSAAVPGPESPNPSDLTFSEVLRSLNPDIERAIRRKIRGELAIASAVATGSASAATSALDPAPANAFTSASQCGSG